MLGSGTIAQVTLMDGEPAADITCASGLVPAPGQYLLAHRSGSDAPLADVLFRAELTADGFVAAPPIPETWLPGSKLHLRGPLGHGFVLPRHARRIALIAVDGAPRRLLALVGSAHDRDGSIALLCENAPEDLPLHIEVQPLSALLDVLRWADYAALDVARDSLPDLGKLLGPAAHRPGLPQAEVLVRVPMPCGALAECGVCAVKLRRGIGLACDQGPVFDLDLLDLEVQ